MAIEIVLPDSGFFALGDTLRPRARPLNGRGDSVAAEIIWATLDPTVLEVDATSGATVGIDSGGSGRLQARVGNLPSNPLTAVAQAPLDTIYRVGSRVADTVTVSEMPRDTVSDSLRVQVEAPAPRMTSAQALIRRQVTYQMEVFPAGAATVTLVPNDTSFTNASGIVAVQVRLDSGAPPDSVRVWARAVHRNGSDVPGSPIDFVVEFRP